MGRACYVLYKYVRLLVLSWLKLKLCYAMPPSRRSFIVMQCGLGVSFTISRLYHDLWLESVFLSSS